jgi:hypothetical protein
MDRSLDPQESYRSLGSRELHGFGQCRMIRRQPRLIQCIAQHLTTARLLTLLFLSVGAIVVVSNVASAQQQQPDAATDLFVLTGFIPMPVHFKFVQGASR